ncbi:MAG: 1-deoxy-D-xylulose-5-phosphate synthase, partial [Acidimicrobiales bacterium]
SINEPADLRKLSDAELVELAGEIRAFIVEAVCRTGGHLGSNLGAVELTLALHRVFDSPKDAILWDTGHQAYVHKLVTGRREGFAGLRQPGGMSGYPSRAESEHDWVSNSHASTILSYAHGLSSALELRAMRGDRAAAERRVIAVVGDGALTGGMAFEALNNLGHSQRRVVIVLNDNGRSYAPTVSRLSEGLIRLRLNPAYVQARSKLEQAVREIPAVGSLAYSGVQGLRAALREALSAKPFFEALGVRYAGPIDGHDIAAMEQAFANAAEYEGPIVVHVATKKGRGYAPAEDDVVQCLHDVKVPGPGASPVAGESPLTYTDVFSQAMLDAAERDPRVVAITAAMPGPTGLLGFQSRFPDRFFDVGIAEQHAVTAAAGMAMGGLKPVVAVYSTFLSRAFDQANMDVGLHELPVVFALDRSGVTGDDGPSHHGVLDIALMLKVPGMTILAPSSAEELEVMVADALALPGPAVVRYPKGAARRVPRSAVGSGLHARRTAVGERVCFLAVGSLLAAAEAAAARLEERGIGATVWDVRAVEPLDPEMIDDAARHQLVVTAEDAMREGGAGMHIADAVARSRPAGEVPPVVVLGTPVRYIPQGKVSGILSGLGLDAAGLAAAAVTALEGGRQLSGSDHVGDLHELDQGRRGTAGALLGDQAAGGTCREPG